MNECAFIPPVSEEYKYVNKMKQYNKHLNIYTRYIPVINGYFVSASQTNKYTLNSQTVYH